MTSLQLAQAGPLSTAYIYSNWWKEGCQRLSPVLKQKHCYIVFSTDVLDVSLTYILFSLDHLFIIRIISIVCGRKSDFYLFPGNEKGWSLFQILDFFLNKFISPVEILKINRCIFLVAKVCRPSVQGIYAHFNKSWRGIKLTQHASTQINSPLCVHTCLQSTVQCYFLFYSEEKFSS